MFVPSVIVHRNENFPAHFVRDKEVELVFVMIDVTYRHTDTDLDVKFCFFDDIFKMKVLH